MQVNQEETRGYLFMTLERYQSENGQRQGRCKGAQSRGTEFTLVAWWLLPANRAPGIAFLFKHAWAACFYVIPLEILNNFRG